nr:MAG TPA: hypothetical protein [Caudoviricetes sp.]
MESLENCIKTFLSTTSNIIYYADNILNFGYGKGESSGYGVISGFGTGAGLCSGEGSSYGYGYGYGSSSGSGTECFSMADGVGSSVCAIYGKGIKELNGDNVYLIDGIQTIIKSVHNNIAQGFILNYDLTLQPCYIVKEQNYFAHGTTLHDAFIALQEKLYNNSTEEERIEAFIKKFPNYDTPYPNQDLFTYHHVLTGSCRTGRENFCENNGINLDDNTTVREFVSLTKNSYGSEIIRKLPKAYGINDNFNN